MDFNKYIDPSYSLRVGVTRSEQKKGITNTGVQVITIPLKPVYGSDLQLLNRFFYEENNPFTTLTSGLDHYRFFCTDVNTLSKIDNFLLEYDSNNKMLFYCIIGLAANSNLAELAAIPESNMGKNGVQRRSSFKRYTDQQKLVNDWKRKGESKIQRLIELIGLDEPNEDKELYHLKKVSFKFEGSNNVTLDFTEYYEKNIILHALSHLASKLSSGKDYDNLLKEEFGVSVNELSESHNKKREKVSAFCKGFVDLVCSGEIVELRNRDHAFQMFYDLFLLCGYESPVTPGTIEPKKAIRQWYERAPK